MAISTRKRTETQPQPPEENIFEALGVQDPDAGSAKGKKAATDANAVTVESLQRQIAEMNARLQQQNEAQLALLASPVTIQGGNQGQSPPLIDLNGLPDPLTETEAYNKALAERITAAIARGNEASNASQQQNASLESRADLLFEDFSEKFEPYSEFPDRVKFAAEKVASRAQQRGIDLNKYMFVTSDRFFNDVVKEYDTTFGKPEGDGDDETDIDQTDEGADTSQPDRGTPQDPDAADGRTASIFGGQNPAGGKRGTGERPSDMIKDITDLQRASGFF